MSEQQEKEATKALSEQLNNAGPVNNERADAIAKEEAEDIDAFLATLESGDADPEPAPAAKAEEDPFAAAFADLEMEHADDMPEPAAPAPKPAPKQEPTKPISSAQLEDAKAKSKAPAPTPEAEAPTALEKVEQTDKPDKNDKKKRKTKKKDDVAVVEKVRSPGFRFFMGTVKFSMFFVPAMLCWWLVGSYTSRLFETGWLVAIVATLVAFIVPAIARFGLGRGKYGWWALGFAVLIVGGLVGGLPSQSGASLAKYGHWPASTVAQLAKWKADNALVTVTASAAEFVGQRVETIRTPTDKPSETRALGTDETLEAFAKTQEPPKKEEDKKDPDTKTDASKNGEDKKADANKDEVKKEETKKEEAPKKEEVKKEDAPKKEEAPKKDADAKPE